MGKFFTSAVLLFTIMLFCSNAILCQNTVLVNFGDNNCSDAAPTSFSLIRNPLTPSPSVLTTCNLASQLPNFYSTFVAYNPENSNMYIADIRTGVTKIWALNMSLPTDISCPTIPVLPDYSYNYIANNFEFDNAGNLWSFSAFNGAAGQCNIDKINVMNGSIFSSRVLQFPAGNFPSDISSGDLCILPNGRMFATLGTGPSRLYEITNYTTAAATATFLTALPQPCFGIAYVNGQLEITGFSASCYRYMYDIAAHTLSTASPFQNNQTPIDNTSFSPALGVTKQLLNATFIAPGTADLVYEIYVVNMGNVKLNDLRLVDDLGAVFGAANVSHVATEFTALTVGPNIPLLVLNTNYNGTTDTDIMMPGIISNLINQNQDYFFKVRLTCRIENLNPSVTYLNSAIATGGIGSIASGTRLTVTDSSNNGSQIVVDPNNNGVANEAGENIPTPFNFSVLPVKFLNISASLVNKNDALVRWSVATPTTDAAYFEPEYSKDGIHFTAFGHINISDRNRSDYDQLHMNIPTGIIFYRVKQVDNNGTYVYSKTVVLRTGKGADNYAVYPNPANNYINIIAASNTLRNATATLYDATGRLLLNTTITSQQLQIDCSSFPPGTYMLKIKDDTGVKTEKILIQR